MDECDEYRCGRCSSIQWETLVQNKPDSRVHLFDVTDTLQGLQASACRICQLLGAAILSAHGPEFRTKTSRSRRLEVSLYWQRSPDIPDTCIGRLDFALKRNDGRTYMETGCIMYNEDDALFDSRSGLIYKLNKRVDFRLAKRWIQDCAATHEECGPSSRETLRDLRVLDCFSRSVISAPKGCDFVALSYVWGDPGIYETMQFLDLPVTLPRTIEDSIEATKMLGYQYLWVDRYCINQTNTIEKHDQINQMGDIYSSAQVTIIAAAGTDSAFGIPGVVRDRLTPQISTKVGRLCMYKPPVSVGHTIHQSVWASRAWTFQEGYLSKRRLYFSEYQLVYICEKKAQNDGLVDVNRGSLSSRWNSLPTGTDWRSWETATAMMKEYLRRDLTYDADALNAIVGALNTLKEVDHIYGVLLTHSEYLGWEKYPQPIALHWVHTSPCPRRKDFPSWSPLGWNGAVDYLHKNVDGDALHAVVATSCSLKVWHYDQYRELSGIRERISNAHTANSPDKLRFLKVSATVVMLDFEYTNKPFFREKGKSGLYVRVPYSQNVELVIYPYWDICIEQVSLGHTKQLPCAVIVRKNEGTPRFEKELMIFILQQHDDYYERIGCFRLEHGRSFARANPGDSFNNERTRYLGKGGDDLYWMKDGEERTFLLG